MSKPHHMTAKYGGLGGSFSAQLQAFADKTRAQVTQVLREVVIQVGSEVIRLSPVDTGRFAANWQLTMGAPASGTVDTVDPDRQATVEKLVQQASQLEAGQVAWLVNNLPYGIPLEHGHSQKAPAGMVQITLAQFQRIVAEAAQRA